MLMFFSSLRISSSLVITWVSYLRVLISLSQDSMLLLRCSISASACDFSSLILITMLERSCSDLDSASFSAPERSSSCSNSRILDSNSSLILSIWLVLLTMTSCSFCSFSSFRLLTCFIHSLRAPSRCAARSSTVSLARVTVSRCVFKAEASASAFSQPETASSATLECCLTIASLDVISALAVDSLESNSLIWSCRLRTCASYL